MPAAKRIPSTRFNASACDDTSITADAAALPDHLVEQLLHVRRFGRGARGLAFLAAEPIRHRAEQARLADPAASSIDASR